MAKDKPTPQKYSKEAFLNAAKNNNERLLLNVLLQDNQSYTKEDVEKAIKTWRNKEVR